MDESEFHDTVLPAAPVDSSAETTRCATVAVLDSVAVVLATLDHEVAVLSRAVYPEPSDAAVVWGLPGRCGLRGAVTANGAALRCYDFNDLYVGASGQGGHPSDAIPALVAVAEQQRRSGAELVRAVTTAYDDIVALMDVANVGAAGWDYANLVGLGSVRAFAGLLGLTDTQRRQAAGIFGATHVATNELESGALDDVGNLTSWKRFNGSSAVLAALDACRLAAGGVAAPYQSLTGEHGFFRLQGLDPAEVAAAAARREPAVGVTVSVLKQWPVGSRAQSAIQAAIALRGQLPQDARIERLTIATHPEVIGHLVRPESFRPLSRETADHSLPYVTAVALTQGDVRFADFDDPAARQRPEVLALLDVTDIEPLPDSRPGAVAGHPTRLTVTLAGGATVTEQRELPPAALSPGALADAIEAKWAAFAEPRLGADRAARAKKLLLGLADLTDIAELTDTLAGDQERGTQS
jgi:2-methylcitrate dehydratase